MTESIFPPWFKEFLEQEERRAEEAHARFEALCDMPAPSGKVSIFKVVTRLDG